MGRCMKPFGKHFIAEFINCEENILNDENSLEQILKLGIKKSGLNLVSLHTHKYDPIGVTVIAIISESHIAVHTYPECRHASVDIFTCSSKPDAEMKMLNSLKSKLKPATIRFIEVGRGNTLEIKQQDWIESFSTYGFNVKYHVEKKILSKKTKYQQIDIIENENFGKMLFLDKDLQIAEKDACIYNLSLILPLIESKNNLNNVAILGGGDGGVLFELLKHYPDNIAVVDIDEEVIKSAKKYLRCICNNAFSNLRVQVIINDANKYLENNYGFDAIIYDLTMHPEVLTGTNRIEYLENFFSKIKNSLNEKGMVTLQCCSEFDTETIRLLKEILPKYFKKINCKKSFIPSFCENWVFMSAEAK